MEMSLTTLQPTARQHPEEAKLRQLSQDMEAAFLSEMLKHAGFGKASETMGGGIGEDQFSSFLIQEHAQALAKSGGIGLAEQIFRSLSGTN